MKNKLRLKAVNNFIDSKDNLADIGCDHGYLGIMALQKGVNYVQFVDNKIGPLNQAVENLKKYNFENINFTLSSGLNNIDDCIDTVSICGMGGELISEILEADLSKASVLNKLILQPNRNEYNLRSFLMNNQFKIIDEDIVYENNKFYEIIVCKKVNHNVKYTEEELIFGPILLNKKSEIFVKKWNEKYKEFLRIKEVNKNSEDNNFKIELLIKNNIIK